MTSVDDGPRADRIVLDDPACGWYVAAGAVDLFATLPGRAWRPLFSAQAGALLVGLPPGARGVVVTARAQPGTTIDRVELAGLQGFDRDGRSGAAALEAGLEGLGAALQRGLAPRRFDALDPETSADFPAGATVRATGTAWVSTSGAGVRALGRAVVREVGAAPPVLVNANDWLELEADAEVRAASTAALLEHGGLGEPLERAQHDAMRALEAMLELEDEHEVVTRRDRQERSAAMGRAVARELTALGDPGSPGAHAVDAGPSLAAAHVVARHLGADVTVPHAWDPGAGSLEHLLHASRMHTRTVRLTDGWHRRDIGTLIAFLGEEGVPAALVHDGRRYLLHDPRAAKPAAVTAAIAAEIGRAAVMVYPPLPTHGLSGLQLLRFGLQGAKRDVGRLLLAGLVIAIIGLLVPILSGRILGVLIPEGEQSAITQLCLVLLLSAVVVALLSAAQNLTATRIEGVLERRLQPAVWARLMELPSAVHRRHSTGDLATTILIVTVMRELLSSIWPQALFSVVLAVVNLALIFVYGVELGLLALLLVLVVVGVTVVAGRIELRNQRLIFAHVKELNSRAFQLIGHVPKLQAAAAEERAFAYWGTAFAAGRRQTIAARRTQIKVAAFQAAYVMLGTLLAFVLVSEVLGDVPLSDFVAFLVALGIVLASTLMVSQAVLSSLTLVPPMGALGALMREEPEVTAARSDPGELSGAIELSHVSYRYSADGPQVLDDVSLSVAPGEFLAVVGPSGSGKSTVLRLMLGFESPEAGVVLYDDHDLADLDVGAVRRQCGVVLQEAQLMVGNVLSNIAGAGTFDIDDAWEAARQAGLSEDVEAMPMGMHTLLSEGASTISGGQRQRIMIARAIVSRPRIVMLDEATSALDNRTQDIVTDSMRRLNATRVVIAHRLSTVRHADRIVVLDKGRVVQTGTYDELLATPGLFRDLALRQIA